MSYFLGVDMGTSSIKASLLDERGVVISTERLPVQLLNPAEGMYEIDPMQTWWQGFVTVCTRMSKQVDLALIRAVCVSSVCGSFVPVDDNFNPLYNAILYGIDTRALAQVEQLNKKYDSAYLQGHLGGPFNSHSIIPKIMWLKENLPQVYNDCKNFVASNNFVTGRLTGIARWDYPTAAGARLVDYTVLGFPEEIFRESGLDLKKIPSLEWPLSTLGRVTDDAAAMTGLRTGTTVVLGACDVNAEAMAIGAVHPGDLMFVYGSTISTLLTAEKHLMLPGFNPGMSILPETYRLGGASSCGASFTHWVDQLVKSDTPLAYTGRPTGILALPYLDGARTPFDNPKATGVFFGLKRHHDNNALRLAAREAIGYEVGLLLGRLGWAYPIEGKIRAVGGLANDDQLMQLISNITGVKQLAFRDIDASFGSALFALHTRYPLHRIDEMEAVQAVRMPRRVFLPEATKRRNYLPYTKQFEGLYEHLSSFF